jgi:TetR/AcrR family transcriptional repressor of nem operon
MMSKGQETRNQIIKQAAEVFNKRGFLGSSISDVMQITGLQKGGIYRHFESKEQLALEAFEYAQAQYSQRLEQAMAEQSDGLAKVRAFVEAFYGISQAPPIAGGCPVMNTIVDSDDGDPALRLRAKAVIANWLSMIEDAIRLGIQQGTIHPDIQVHKFASIIIAMIEGGILLSQAHHSLRYMRFVYEHLLHTIDTQLAI